MHCHSNSAGALKERLFAGAGLPTSFVMAVLVTAIHAVPPPLGLKAHCVGAACGRMQSIRLGVAGTSPAMTGLGRASKGRARVRRAWGRSRISGAPKAAAPLRDWREKTRLRRGSGARMSLRRSKQTGIVTKIMGKTGAGEAIFGEQTHSDMCMSLYEASLGWLSASCSC